MAAVDKPYRLGLVVNPLAGIGGPLARKGSDSGDIQALGRGLEYWQLPAILRAQLFLSELQPLRAKVEFFCAPDWMGQNLLQQSGFAFTVANIDIAVETTAADTINCARLLREKGIDLLIFVGGDGTACDIVGAIGAKQLVLGVPAGVKMHSAVFGVNPYAAAQLVIKLVGGELVGVGEREVRDIDEQAFREGRVASRHFGLMLVPEENQFVQHVKQGGLEVEELVLDDIAAELQERLAQCPDPYGVVFGAGGTVFEIQHRLGFPASLLGIDAVDCDGNSITDIDEQSLASLINSKPDAMWVVVLSPIGGQGHILGRGNQQISPRVLQKIDRSHIWIVATKTKLNSLSGRPLILDTGDRQLDNRWSGMIGIITGYRQETLYRLQG